MTVRQNGGRQVVEFQMAGKRIFRRLRRGFGPEDAEALEQKLRRDIFNESALGIVGDLPPSGTEEQWQRVANMLLHASGVQPAPGIYFLCKAGRLVYIGRSKNVAHRLGDHRDKDYDHAVMLPLSLEYQGSFEAFLINMLRPPLNFPDEQK